MRRKYCLFVLVGATGAGKDKIMDALFDHFGEKLGHYQSLTTRPRREGESPDAYEFVTQEEGERLITEGGLFEWYRPFASDPVNPKPYIYGRRMGKLKLLDEMPLICDMTEEGVQTHEQLVDSGELEMRVIRVVPKNMAPLARRDERRASDANRALVPIRTHYVLVNDHAPGGFDQAVQAAIAYVDINQLTIAA